ncbi:hypothetical protein DBV15_04140 [Temnothorax longispinosus]|uniref:Uncharacterized protein n=1 Tax=Temnothorax longispinosus TaxID=300112 RepID=A0A4S2KWF0_9HYME|nr:hypothetical protein DBV15_04140 [Temnothorax longispinosus]
MGERDEGSYSVTRYACRGLLQAAKGFPPSRGTSSPSLLAVRCLFPIVRKRAFTPGAALYMPRRATLNDEIFAGGRKSVGETGNFYGDYRNCDLCGDVTSKWHRSSSGRRKIRSSIEYLDLKGVVSGSPILDVTHLRNDVEEEKKDDDDNGYDDTFFSSVGTPTIVMRKYFNRKEEINVTFSRCLRRKTSKCTNFDKKYATAKISNGTPVHQTSQPLAKPVAKKPEASWILTWKRLDRAGKNRRIETLNFWRRIGEISTSKFFVSWGKDSISRNGFLPTKCHFLVLRGISYKYTCTQVDADEGVIGERGRCQAEMYIVICIPT